MTEERTFFPYGPGGASPERRAPLQKTFFDVHMDNMPPEISLPLLRIMADHGLAKDDPGLVFGMVFLSIQSVVSEIPEKAREAVNLSLKRSSEMLDEHASRILGDHARMLSEHAARVDRAAEEALRGHLAESAAALEARVLEGVERRLYAALAKNSILVAHESAAALRGALTRELADAGKDMEKLSETAREARDTIRWLPWWLLALFGMACFALGWCARGGFGL